MHHVVQDHYNELAIAANKVTVGASATGLVIGGLDFSQLMAAISVGIAFTGLLASIYFQWQRNQILKKQVDKEG